MKDVFVTNMGNEPIAIFTSQILFLKEKEGSTGTYIHIREMEEPLYTSKSITAVLQEIEATR